MFIAVADRFFGQEFSSRSLCTQLAVNTAYMHVGEPGFTEAAEVAQGLTYDEVPGRMLASFIPTFMQREDFERIMVSRFREVRNTQGVLCVHCTLIELSLLVTRFEPRSLCFCL